jgi:FkbM family methyltransferase
MPKLVTVAANAGVALKNVFLRCGLDICRVKHKYEWLRPYNIRTILDIGANIGYFSATFHKILPQAAIYAFEPLADCYKQLLKRMKKVPQFHAFNYALGDADSDAKIYHSEFSQSSSLLRMEELHKQAFPHTKKLTSEVVSVVRLDEISRDLDLIDNILIKIDVQGYENKVIAGGRQTFSRAKVLIVETSFQTLYREQVLFDAIYDLLKSLGFCYMGNLGQLKDPRNGSVLQADSIFVRTK